ncbi:FkbM family methyltransferase [Streptomyces acidiscabies]|uniref:FkbM family methyltransferase n=1 Tax=Streptomyces acidiscabies TaxID=42234 RepID=A0ABU4MGI4_9ACTN|nr:FkbM family methyltransferase [Streptomyces acidiscabies]MDX3025808.1 FkbM family methyltransferase [Streptomyces acidiscabies]
MAFPETERVGPAQLCSRSGGALPGAGSSGATASCVPRLPAGFAEADGVEAGLLARTVFAVVLAVCTDARELRVACGTAEVGEPLRVEALRVLPQASIRQLSAQWRSGSPVPVDAESGGLATLQHLVDSAVLPAFDFSASGSASPALLASFTCSVRTVPEGWVWTFSSLPSAFDEDVLRALAERVEAVSHALVTAPDLTAEQAAALIRPLAFEVRVLAGTGFSEMTAALRGWGHAVGLPVVACRVEAEETQAPAPAKGYLQPAAWGANLVVLQQGLGSLPQPRLTEDPDGMDGLAAELGELPDGRPIVEANANETRELYDEIVTRNQYLRHGVRLCDGDVVVDVGSNIGMFALFAAAQADKVIVHAFEPVPVVAQALGANMRLYGVTGTVSCAAAGASTGVRALTFYPQSSLQSGFYADAQGDQQIVGEYARHQAEALPDLTAELRAVAAEALAPTARARTADRQELEVPVIRLSDWIRGSAVGRIDLLKVDAERAEEDVLAGIDDEHWPLIGQVVAEVHDLDGRVDRLRALLQGRGFETVVDQDPLFAGSEIFMLYGLRPDASRAEAPWVERQIAAAERWAQTSALPLFVTVPPGAMPAETRTARQAVEARGLTWVEPPSAGAAGAAGERDVVPAWAEAVLRRLTADQRPVTKGVIVDGDNTLWGGVCGEVGPESVDVAGPYRQVQEALREQLEAGRVLCLCSRNNLVDMEAVFAAHPDMPLALGDFTVVRAGWGAKSVAVGEIAEELSFAVESLVFVDDSAAERAEVALAHPGITVVDLPAHPEAFIAALRGTWQLALEGTGTAEDRARSALIAVEARRRRAAAQTATPAEYLEQLDLRVEVLPAQEEEVERIAQLAARTTQFNLVLRRHTPGTVRQVLAGAGVALSVRVRDRFGDYGLVGFVSADADGRVLRVQDFFVSCRALGRSVEWCVLRELAGRACALGLDGLALPGVPGPRNRPALEFAAAAQGRFGLPGAPDLVDAAAAAALDWRLVTAPQAAATPVAGEGRAAGAVSRVRWPVSQQAAVLAADAYRRPGETASTTPYVAPETETERLVAAVWEETLKLAPIGVHDDLFTMGGDSLTAAVICARLRRHSVDLAVHELLAHPTVRGAARQASAARRSAIELPADAEAGPASLGQQRIWAAEVVGGRGNAQVIPLAYRIVGPLDLDRLRSALAAVVARHSALRTVLVDDDGKLVQRRLTAEGVGVEVHDVSRLPTTERADRSNLLARRFFQTPFDVGQDVLLRAAVLRQGADGHELLLMLHHSAADGWSLDVLQRDLGAAYADPQALAGPAGGATFAQYSAAAARRRESGAFDAGAAAVRGVLDRAAARPWSTASGLPAEPRHLRFALDADLVTTVWAAARARAVTPVSVHLAAWQVLLAAAAGTNTVVTGCPVAGRGEEAFADTVGFFANLVPVPARVDWSATTGRHLEAAVTATAEALSHAEVPYGLIADGTGALFDTLFTLQPPAAHPLRLASCTVAGSEPALWPVPYPLMLDVQEHADGASALLRFDANACHPVDPPWLAEAYPLVLAALCTLPELPLQRLRDLLRPATATVQDLVRARVAHLREDGDSR